MLRLGKPSCRILVEMFKSYWIRHKQVRKLKDPIVFGCGTCSFWFRRFYGSFDPDPLAAVGRDTVSPSKRKIASNSNPVSLYLQYVSWRPELFSFKELGILLDKQSLESMSIPDKVFEEVENSLPDLKQVLKKSHDFLGRVEYVSFFSCVLNFIRRDLLEMLKKEKSSKEQLDLILKYRREQGQLLEMPKFVKNRLSSGNSLWKCSLLLSGYNVESSPCKSLKTGKWEVYTKAVFKIFADFVKNIENDLYSDRRKHDNVSFDSTLRGFIAERQPSRRDLNSIALLKGRLEKVIQKQYPNCSLEMFGSAVTGLWKPSSDVDFVVLPNVDFQEKKSSSVKYLRALAGALRKTEMFSVLLISNAKVPIIKFVDYSSGLKGDVSWGSRLGIINSKLIKQYLDMNQQLKDFVWLVKEWATSRQVVGASRHFPSSYCWVLICLWFLQRVKKILPVIFIPEDVSKRKQLDWVSVYTVQKEAKNISCEDTLTQLLEQFFRYFAYEISFDTVMFVSQNSRLMKQTKENKWKVEDPLEIERDLMCHVNHAHFQVILYELLRAHRIISTDSDVLKLFEIPKGETIRRRMTGCFDCLLETELNNQSTSYSFR